MISVRPRLPGDCVKVPPFCRAHRQRTGSLRTAHCGGMPCALALSTNVAKAIDAMASLIAVVTMAAILGEGEERTRPGGPLPPAVAGPRAPPFVRTAKAPLSGITRLVKDEIPYVV